MNLVFNGKTLDGVLTKLIFSEVFKYVIDM